MELSKNFDHSIAEQKWYQHWLDKRYFHSEPDDREPYTVVIPPPNVTGVLHMGHCLNNTIQDILVRRARMLGKNACWVPGTDHASIATEAKVVQMLRERGIAKSSLSRDNFLNYAWEWKEKYGGIILQQLKKIGCSLDWDRTSFTMDPDYYQSVINVFIDLYNKGHIYRGKRMINWDPKARTALSDEEVIRKEVQSKLYFLRYRIDNSRQTAAGSRETTSDNEEYITIATVRPETILGDTAIAVNPNDDRYKHLHGQFAFVPLINRRIPIIADEYVEIDFGTGALKVTPAHDKNDYVLGEKHGLEVIDTMNDDGTMSEAAQLYIGEDRFEARKKIVKELETKGHVVKIDNYTNQIGFSERTDVVVEDRLSLQWWVDMKKLYEPALKAVMADEIKFYPAKFKNLYRNWMENIRDWCISRQLWWGHRIPAWYTPDGSFVVAATKEEALVQLKINNEELIIENISQDEDVLDTWFSSWLWPFEVFKGYSHPNNEEVNYYYPTNTLVTAPEIIFFWVARMIMAGYEYRGERPFNDVYFTGIVRDKQGRKMSKQLGNSPDLLELIENDGADAVRFGIMIASPAGNDLMWDPAGNEQGRFFINKMWNALRLVKMWEGKQSAVGSQQSEVGSRQSAEKNFAVEWFENRLNEVKMELDAQFKDFRLSESLKTIYSLIWDDFCSWYLEWVKPGFEQPIDKAVYEKTVNFFEQLMQLLHPFMPFITEEIYHQLKERTEGDDILIKQLSTIKEPNKKILELGEKLKKTIQNLKDIRAKLELRKQDLINPKIITGSMGDYKIIEPILTRQTGSASLEFIDHPFPNSLASPIEKDIFYIPIITSSSTTTTTTRNPIEEQREKLKQDLSYLQGFLISVEKKLGNELFVQNAKPEVIESERKKKADAEAKIRAIEESLASL